MGFHVPEINRITKGPYGSPPNSGNFGAFVIEHKGILFRVIASDQLGWEHVSVSIGNRCPTWDEMCYIKSIFWDTDDTVIQYHPAEQEYVNNHPHCLHLWRPIGQTIPTPPAIMVGIKEKR